VKEERNQEKWDARFVEMAHLVAGWSKDPDRKNGAVLVTPDLRKFSVGFNGLPRGVADTPERLGDRYLKNQMMVHAELNAIFNAGFDPAGCGLYVTRFPCHVCAQGIIQTRVALVVAPKPDFDHPRWGASWALARAMLGEAGVEVRRWEGRRAV
jgi:dCMP deaminase